MYNRTSCCKYSSPLLAYKNLKRFEYNEGPDAKSYACIPVVQPSNSPGDGLRPLEPSRIAAITVSCIIVAGRLCAMNFLISL